MGPTATGKTDVAAALVDEYPFEIISVDSSLVYRDMDIGTAKPDEEFLKRYPHHLVNIRNPDQVYSVAEFCADAEGLIEEILGRDRIPLLVGGTMFYFHSLEHGLTELPGADEKVRQDIEKRATETGWPAMHAELRVVDPDSAARIDPNDAQRIQRALEVYRISGQTVGQHSVPATGKSRPPGYPMVKMALAFSDRRLLHKRIQARFDSMLEAGLVDEARNLLEHGFDPKLPALRIIGYRQAIEYLQGSVSWDEMRNMGVAATRQLAKRQLTWLRNQSNITWFVDSGLKDGNFKDISQYIRETLPDLSL
jgi:tRNA dimethylallyltransferase